MSEQTQSSGKTRTEEKRSNQIRNFVSSYESVILQNDLNGYPLITTSDLFSKVFERDIYPYCLMNEENTPSSKICTISECGMSNGRMKPSLSSHKQNHQQFLACFAENDNHLYYLLRSGLLYSYSPAELMSQWFRIQKKTTIQQMHTLANESQHL